MTGRQRWLSLLWPLVLLALFAGTFRRAGPTLAGDAVAAGCDPLPPTTPRRLAAADLDRFERCLAIDPGNAELLIDLGRAYAAESRLAQAEPLYRRALRIDPANSDLHVWLGELLLDRGDRGGARREALDALRWRPNGLAATRLMSQISGEADRAR
jgi:tetratricopeptide (TPR) repeat protein